MRHSLYKVWTLDLGQKWDKVYDRHCHRAPTRQRFNLSLLLAISLNENMRVVVVRVRAWGQDVAVAVVVDHVAVGEAHSQYAG